MIDKKESFQVEHIILRRKILDWRDKYIEEVDHQFSNNLNNLYALLDRKIDDASLLQVFGNNDTFYNKHVKPIYNNWVEKQGKLFVDKASEELQQIINQSIKQMQYYNKLNYRNSDLSHLGDTASSIASTGAALLSIPTVISLSTSTITTGGFLGFFTVTTTVVSWPIAIAGGLVVGSLFLFGSNKALKIKKNKLDNIQRDLKDKIFNNLIYNDNGNSICQELKKEINNDASKMIENLNYD